MKTCKGCGVEFEPTHHLQKYHSDECYANHHRLENRDRMKQARKSPVRKVNIGGMMDLIDKRGPITMRRDGKTYIFSTISRNGKVQIPA